MENNDKLQLLEQKSNTRKQSQKYKGEYKELDKVQSFLESINIKVWREVIPDQCINWDFPYSVDLIFELQNYGLIAIEGKHLNTHGKGSKYAEAYLQIRDKYSNKTYFGRKRVRRWCVFGKTRANYEKWNIDGGNDGDVISGRLDCFLKHFFNKLGISYLTFDDRYLVIDSTTINTLIISKEKGIADISGDDKDNFLDYGENIK